jgi:DNA gyrase subunit A
MSMDNEETELPTPSENVSDNENGEPENEPDTPSGPDIAVAVLEREEEPRMAVYDGPQIDISEELRTSYLGYAMSTIISRALPDVRDGFKPVQRRILYAMRELGLSPNSRHLKSAKVVGECFVAGTKVSTPQGLRPIETLEIGESVYTQSGVRKITECYVMTPQPLLRVELSDGRFVTCTRGQQFKMLQENGDVLWQDAKNLKIGDVLLSRRNTHGETHTSEISEDVAYMLGIFLADGWVDRDQKRDYQRLAFGVQNSSIAILERVQDTLKSDFSLDTKIEQRDNMCYLRVNSTQKSREILEKFNLLNKYADNISVPESLFTAPREIVFAFLSGFIDGDGSIHKNRATIILTSICQDFLGQVQTLLFSQGIQSHLLCYDKKEGRAEWALEVRGKSAQRLASNLTLSHPKKAARLDEQISNYACLVEQGERIPYLGQILWEEFQTKHLGGGWYEGVNGKKVRSGLRYANGTKFRYSKDAGDSFQLSYPLIHSLGIDEKLATIGSSYAEILKNWEEQGVCFHTVRRITPISEQITYDIQVEEEHEFIANGMLVHNCMGNYHPHGDMALYLTMVRMAQPFSLRYPLVDGQGNFGSVDDDPPAAMRYTEARLTALAMEMMEDIEKDTVDFMPTYDNERREPTILPGKFPNLLCNGGSGIAVAMATNMPPHNLGEVCEGLMLLLDHPDATLEQLIERIPAPDFPTGGLILGTKGVREAYEMGRGSVTMQAKTSIEPMDNGKNAIIVTELPYQVIKAKLIVHIGELARDKKIDGITAVNDYSDRSGMRIVIELRRDVMPQKVLNALLKHTPMRLNFSVNNVTLIERGRAPKILSLKSILQQYIDHRREVITRRTKFELARAKARAHILEGLQIAVGNLDEVIAIIRASPNTEQARSRLIERFTFTGPQADAILSMQLRQLTGLEQDRIEGEYKDLLKEIGRLEDILSDTKRVDAIIKADLKYLRDKFGDERRTKIIPTEAEDINIEDLIADEEMLITITRDGYIRRLEPDIFPTQNRGGKGRNAGKTKEEDNFEHVFIASTHDYILFFTDRGRVYRLKAYDVPQTSRQAMGTYLTNLIQIMPDEKITATVPIRDFRTATGALLMVTERGEIKKTKIEEYINLRANGLNTFDIEPDDRLGWVRLIQGDEDVILTTVRGMAVRFPESKVPSRGRAAGGVRGVTLEGPNDRVVAADIITTTDCELLVVGENGLGKRTAISEYRITNRGGKGVKTMDVTEKTGNLVTAAIMLKENIPSLRLVLVTEKGIGIRMKVDEVRASSRSTQGVKLINLTGDDRVKTAELIDTARKTSDDGEG